ncbi:MAG: glycosyltransferase [Candidatus Rokubacteria bacterium]|nr:glycosyltransferase [Candidatus Rokubacteria bacterium]
MVDLSVVVPLYNETASLPTLYEHLREVLQRLGLTYEIVFVDDGSTDGSSALLLDLAAKDPTVTLVAFRRNFGKAAALSSGFRHARGQTIVTMDADLQDDPKEIPRFLDKLRDGCDLVTGWKHPRRDPFSKTFPSRVINTLVNWVAGTSLHDMNCGFKAYRREVVDALHLYGGRHRYIPLLATQIGFNVGEIAIRHHPRKFGRSKYRFSQRWPALFDLVSLLFLTRFNRKPLHLLGGLGVSAFGIGLGLCVYLSWIRLFQGEFIGHRPLLLLGVILMILGVQLFSFGLLAEMLTSFHHVDSDEHVRAIVRGGRRVEETP